MHLGILQCDRVREVFAEEHGQYPEMFASLLLPADPTLKFTIFDAEQGELPNNIDVVDAYLITGSRYGVNDGFAWIAQLEEFVRRLYDANKKVIGICFGHQLIAKALGGKVIKWPNGWGVGMSQNRMLVQDPWMTPYQEHINLLVSHQDQVVEIPPHAEILSASDFCPNYMMQIGKQFFTVQGHPEFSKAYSRDLIGSREDILSKELYSQSLKSLELLEDSALLARWITRFLQG